MQETGKENAKQDRKNNKKKWMIIAVCAFGKNQPHRSFMHSIMAMAILSAAISMVSVKLVLYGRRAYTHSML